MFGGGWNTTGLFGNQGLSNDASALLGALTNRKIAGTYDGTTREQMLQTYAQQIHRATLQQNTDAIMRIAPLKQVDSTKVTFTEITFDSQWWSVLAEETTPNVGFLEQNEREQRLLHRGAAVRVHTTALALPAGRADFKELLQQQAHGMGHTMAVLTVRTLADQGIRNTIASLDAGGTALSRVAVLKSIIGAGSDPTRVAAAVGNIVGRVKNASMTKAVILIDASDAGQLSSLSAGMQPGAEDDLPRPSGVETPAARPIMATPFGDAYAAPRSVRRVVNSNGTVVRRDESLLATEVTVLEYAAFPSEASGSAPGNAHRVIEIADYQNGKGWRQIGFDTALLAGRIGDEVIVAGTYAGDSGPKRNLPWNASTNGGMVEKASVLGQLDEAIMPTDRFGALASVMAQRRTIGGAADFNAHANDMQILIGMLSSVPVTQNFVAGVQNEFVKLGSMTIGNNQTDTTRSAGWIPSSHVEGVARIPDSRSATDLSDVPPGLLSATGITALISTLRAWGSENTVAMATRVMAFLASLEASLRPTMDINVFLGAAAVPQNLPKDVSIQGGRAFHLLALPAVPVFVKAPGASESLEAKISFSEKVFTRDDFALSSATISNDQLAVFNPDKYGQSQFAMRGGNVILRNADTGSEIAVPAHIAYAYLYTLPTLAVARRLPATSITAYQTIAAATKPGAFRRFAQLVPADTVQAVHLINYVTGDQTAAAETIEANVATILKNPGSISDIIEKKAKTGSLPKVIRAGLPTAGIAFGLGIDTDFALWKNVSDSTLPYLNTGSNPEVLRSVSTYLSQELDSAGTKSLIDTSGVLDNEYIKQVLAENSTIPEPQKVPVSSGLASYNRTDLMLSPAQAQQLYEIAQRPGGTDFMLPGDPETGYTQPLRPRPGGFFSISASHTSSVATNVQMLADMRLKATKAAAGAMHSGSAFTPVRPKTDFEPRAMLRVAQPLSAEKMAAIMSHPNMVARLRAVDGYSPAERLSALLILGTRCDNTDSLLLAHRNGIPLPFGIAVFRGVKASMRSIVAVAPGEQTAYNAVFNPRTTAGMDPTQNITFVSATMHHDVIVQGRGVATAPGFILDRVVSGGSVDFVTADNPGAGSLHVAVVPLGWTARGDINLVDGTSGIPAASELKQRILTSHASVSQGADSMMFSDLTDVAVQADFRVPTVTPMGATIMMKQPGTNFGHLVVHAD
ncbi:MAG: hypothetical protein AB7P49_00205 [Bdellovibrionales bacterium]